MNSEWNVSEFEIYSKLAKKQALQHNQSFRMSSSVLRILKEPVVIFTLFSASITGILI